MSYQQIDLEPARILMAVTENLNRFFYENSRDESKKLYQYLEEGKQMPFMKIDAGDAGEVFLELSMDRSEYVGKLNFGQFRKNLAMMMLGIKNKVEAEEEIRHLSSETGDMLFNIPGIVKNKDIVNVMVCALRPLAPGLINLQLMFLNPEQFDQAVNKQDQ